MEWLGPYMALQRNVEYDPTQTNGAPSGEKKLLARYRGQTCRVKYAEALWAPRKQPVEIL